MKVLMIYPETPETFWSFKEAVKFISKKSTQPPLGLMTIAAMLPGEWDLRLIDVNVSPLKDSYILWADVIFISGMNVHKESFSTIIRRCNELKRPVVAGGPMVTLEPESFLGIDSFVLGESEELMEELVRDLSHGTLKKEYKAEQFPSMTNVPLPRWDLIEMDKYASMSLQYSRGCPFHCEFCSVVQMNGHQPRTKSTDQFIQELDSLFAAGWTGPVFVVDDNFIGNKRIVKESLLPAIIEWQQEHQFPFNFGVEASINLADDPYLVKLMAEAGFDHAFIGIETVSEESLLECGKKQNAGRDLLEAVQFLHRHGIQVSAGFILGFDHDTPSVFNQLVQFVQKSGIVTAMIGLLNAPQGTPLFERLKREGRLINTEWGNNMDGRINFIPKMSYKTLISGYKSVLDAVYASANFYDRTWLFIKNFHPINRLSYSLQWYHIKALLKSIWLLGILGRERRYYWKLFFKTLLTYPSKFSTAITMAIYGYHFRKIAERV
ncbi:MAG: B12-binding domain-containing radical SAM protein [Calditrichia bacterium]